MRVAVLLAVGALVVLAVVTARGRSGIPIGESVLGQNALWRTGGADGQASSNLQPVAYGAGVIIVVMSVLLLLGLSVFLAGFVTFRLWRERRRKGRAPALLDGDATADAQEWVAKAARRALSEMDRKQGGPPGDAVIAAWVQLEHDAAALGTERQPHQTPSEFTAAVLANHDTNPVALKQLRTLYHRARFGPPDTVTTKDVAEAREALEAL